MDELLASHPSGFNAILAIILLFVLYALTAAFTGFKFEILAKIINYKTCIIVTFFIIIAYVVLFNL